MIEPMICLTQQPIDYAALTETVRTNAAGAVVLFLGTVREVTDLRRTIALDYEAYVPMAEAKLAEIEAEARRRWPVERIAVVHRVGHLDPGEISVAVAVSCPHRDEAFEAARFVIDTLKATVPIWKKENWSDGTHDWVHPGVEDTGAANLPPCPTGRGAGGDGRSQAETRNAKDVQLRGAQT
jgi:molybdopterin synthase catalytic subunit